MLFVRSAAFAKFTDCQALFVDALVFVGAVVDLATFRAFQSDHVVLAHRCFVKGAPRVGAICMNVRMVRNFSVFVKMFRTRCN